MNSKMSPKFELDLIKKIIHVLTSSLYDEEYITFYINKWIKTDYMGQTQYTNIRVSRDINGFINLKETLHNTDQETLLKMAIDLGLETPDYIPLIPIFRNEIKSSHQTASVTFEKAIKQVEEHPDMAIGLANSALESIVKEILKDERIDSKIKGTETLYNLVSEILKVLKLYPNATLPDEIRQIGSSLLAVNKGIEKLRSEKTNVHGKTKEDYVVEDSLYAYFVINSVTTVGLFLNSYYKTKFPKSL